MAGFIETEAAICDMSRALSGLSEYGLTIQPLRMMFYASRARNLTTEFHEQHDAEAARRESLRRTLFANRNRSAA